jgi:hypothetical protein
MPMCEGKKKFVTKAKAEYILNSAWRGAIRNGKTHELPCRAYKCRECGKWHLTSKKLWTTKDRENVSNNK